RLHVLWPIEDRISSGVGRPLRPPKTRRDAKTSRVTSYDDFASHYDAWIAGFSDDVTFYVDLAHSSGGPIVELGVGTGRVAIPTARAGVPVLGIDASERMLEVCRLNAE